MSELVPPSNERVYVLANPDWFSEEEQIWWDYDHPSGCPLYLSPEGGYLFYDGERFFEAREPIPFVSADWYWDKESGKWVIDGSPESGNPNHVPFEDMNESNFQPGWYQHEDELWYPYPPYPGYRFDPREGYVDVCDGEWGWEGGGGSSVTPYGGDVVPQPEIPPFGPSENMYQRPGTSVVYDPCAEPEVDPEEPQEPEESEETTPPVETEEPTTEPESDPETESGDPEVPIEQVVERRERVVAAEQPAPQGERGIAARTGEIASVGIAVALFAAAGGGLAFLRRRSDK